MMPSGKKLIEFVLPSILCPFSFEDIQNVINVIFNCWLKRIRLHTKNQGRGDSAPNLENHPWSM
jgi:hypothetical protein